MNLTTPDPTSLLTTTFSMIFTVISILLSVFEYIFAANFIHNDSNILVTFSVTSKDIASMTRSQFTSQLVFQNWKLITAMAKILKVNTNRIERLKPKMIMDGAMYTFVLTTEQSQYDHICQIMHDVVDNDQLAKVCMWLDLVYVFVIKCDYELLYALAELNRSLLEFTKYLYLALNPLKQKKYNIHTRLRKTNPGKVKSQWPK